MHTNLIARFSYNVVTMVTGKLEVFSETEVPGCVYCIVSFNGRLVAAINNRVSECVCVCVCT